MTDMKTVDEIEISYSKSQIYWRIKKLVEKELMASPERGERNQYLLGPEDVKLLQKLEDIEKRRESLKDAIQELEDQEPLEETNEGPREKIESLEKRIDKLEKKVKKIEDKLATQEDTLQRVREGWRSQLKGGVEKVKKLFG